MSMLTFAPSTGCPCASFTTPLTIPVDCAAAGDASDRANPAAHATSHGSRPFNRRTMESSWKNESNYRVGLVYIDPRPTRTGSIVQGLRRDVGAADIVETEPFIPYARCLFTRYRCPEALEAQARASTPGCLRPKPAAGMKASRSSRPGDWTPADMHSGQTEKNASMLDKSCTTGAGG